MDHTAPLLQGVSARPAADASRPRKKPRTSPSWVYPFKVRTSSCPILSYRYGFVRNAQALTMHSHAPGQPPFQRVVTASAA